MFFACSSTSTYCWTTRPRSRSAPTTPRRSRRRSAPPAPATRRGAWFADGLDPHPWLPAGIEALAGATRRLRLGRPRRLRRRDQRLRAGDRRHRHRRPRRRPRPGPPRRDAPARPPRLRRPRRADLVETVPEAITHLLHHPIAARRADAPFVSGPSATSDIELKRVEGVHGPRRLELIVAGSGLSRVLSTTRFIRREGTGGDSEGLRPFRRVPGPGGRPRWGGGCPGLLMGVLAGCDPHEAPRT